MKTFIIFFDNEVGGKMFCGNCGFKNEDSASFCGKCGSQLKQSSIQAGNTPVIGSVSKVQFDKDKILSVVNSIKNMPRKQLGGVLAAIAVVIIAIIAGTNYTPTINLNNYVKVEYDGYEGYGSASAYVDWYAIEEKYGSKVSFTKAARSLWGYSEVEDSVAYVLQQYISIDLDKSYNLVNGEEVTYSWNIDEENIERILDCKIKYKEKSVEVSGLEVLDTFDPFNDITVSFSGVNSEGTRSLEYTGEMFSASDFYFSNDSYDLSNGDVVIVYFEPYVEYCAAEYNLLPSAVEKEYVVEGLGEYASSLSEIDDDLLGDLKKEVETYIIEKIKPWSSIAELQTVTYIGNYLATPEEDAEVSTKNLFGLVYKIDSTLQVSEDAEVVNVTQYYTLEFKNTVVNDEGSLSVNLNQYIRPSDSFSVKVQYGSYSFSYYTYSFYGYKTTDELIETRSSYYDDFEYEWNLEGKDEA
jgi:hypothetical protein